VAGAPSKACRCATAVGAPRPGCGLRVCGAWIEAVKSGLVKATARQMAERKRRHDLDAIAIAADVERQRQADAEVERELTARAQAEAQRRREQRRVLPRREPHLRTGRPQDQARVDATVRVERLTPEEVARRYPRSCGSPANSS
jgi:hypothetical protein